MDNNFIDCVIQLPANLFFGTTIAACIMVLKRGKADNRTLFMGTAKDLKANIAELIDCLQVFSAKL